MSEEIEFVIDRKNRVDFKQVINMKIQYEVLINELKQENQNLKKKLDKRN